MPAKNTATKKTVKTAKPAAKASVKAAKPVKAVKAAAKPVKVPKTTKVVKESKPAKTNNKSRVLQEAMTKTQMITEIADSTALSRKQVQSVLDELNEILELHIKKRSVGHFVFPGLMKVAIINKPAVKARKGINPFTKEEVMFKAKPARNVVKIRPLKKLKDMVA
jgi:nucleoid DNA-binding protein